MYYISFALSLSLSLSLSLLSLSLSLSTYDNVSVFDYHCLLLLGVMSNRRRLFLLTFCLPRKPQPVARARVPQSRLEQHSYSWKSRLVWEFEKIGFDGQFYWIWGIVAEYWPPDTLLQSGAFLVRTFVLAAAWLFYTEFCRDRFSVNYSWWGIPVLNSLVGVNWYARCCPRYCLSLSYLREFEVCIEMDY